MVLLPGCSCCGGSACYCISSDCSRGIAIITPAPQVHSGNVACGAWTPTSARNQTVVNNDPNWPYGDPYAAWAGSRFDTTTKTANNIPFGDGLQASIRWHAVWADLSIWYVRVDVVTSVYCSANQVRVGLVLEVRANNGPVSDQHIRLQKIGGYVVPSTCVKDASLICPGSQNVDYYHVDVPLDYSISGGTTSFGNYDVRYRTSYPILDNFIDFVEAQAQASFRITSRAPCA